jgi:hypothetical protein
VESSRRRQQANIVELFSGFSRTAVPVALTPHSPAPFIAPMDRILETDVDADADADADAVGS